MDLIYRSFPVLPFTSKELFDALYEAIRIRIEQEVGEKIIFEALHSNSSEVIQRLDRITQCLDSSNKLHSLSASQIKELRIKIARGIETANKYINLETNQGTKKVSLKKHVIAARLNTTSVNKVPAQHRDLYEDGDIAVNYIAFRRSFNRAVILGDPGGGKSTLTQLLCYDLSNQIVLEANNPLDKNFDHRDMALPIRVILRTLDKRQQQDAAYNILDYIIDEVRAFCDNDREMARVFMVRSLVLGQIVLLFDGLDEILEVETRNNVVSMVEQFIGIYAACPAIVTSRIVGYKDAPPWR